MIIAFQLISVKFLSFSLVLWEVNKTIITYLSCFPPKASFDLSLLFEYDLLSAERTENLLTFNDVSLKQITLDSHEERRYRGKIAIAKVGVTQDY